MTETIRAKKLHQPGTHVHSGAPASGAAAEAASALEGLVDDYAAAYAAMKEQLEVRLRHETRRGDFFEARSLQLEADVRETTAEVEATRRCAAARSGNGVWGWFE